MKEKPSKKIKESSKTKETDDSGLEDMQIEELSGSHEIDSLEVSDTDDDEDEGVGDGTMGKSMEDPLRDK